MHVSSIQALDKIFVGNVVQKYDINIATGADILGYRVSFLEKKREIVYVYPENADLDDIAYWIIIFPA